MAAMADELIAAKVKFEDAITELVNAFQKETGVEVGYVSFNRRDSKSWPVPVFYASAELRLEDHREKMSVY